MLVPRAGFACGCEQSDTYHFWPHAGLIELVGDNGSVVRDAGKTGEIVLTGFLNRATQAGMDAGLFKPSGYVSPRLGAAWRPFGKDTTVVRAG